VKTSVSFSNTFEKQKKTQENSRVSSFLKTSSENIFKTGQTKPDKIVATININKAEESTNAPNIFLVTSQFLRVLTHAWTLVLYKANYCSKTFLISF